MDNPQSVASSLNQNSMENSSVSLSSSNEVTRGSTEGFIGVLQVHIHQASEIQDICIYQKQDVYAKLYLTSDLESTVSTRVVNGGGRNPIFDETLNLYVRTVESSLKCEVWMLSRVRNYLVDQLLGFALIPLCEVVNSKILQKEYSLSLSDLAPTVAGFVKLSLSYCGTSPEVMAIPGVPPNSRVLESDAFQSVPSPYDTIEFPDPQIVKENHMMISEYLELLPDNLDCENAEQHLKASEIEATESEEVLSSKENYSASTRMPNPDALCRRVPAHELSPTSAPVSTQPISHATEATASQTKQAVSIPAEKDVEAAHVVSESVSNGEEPLTTTPTFNFNTKPEEPQVVEQDIVDMYMKSMQQFTDSLSKMKIPLASEDQPPNSDSLTGSNLKSALSESSNSRVFYGSRAFF